MILLCILRVCDCRRKAGSEVAGRRDIHRPWDINRGKAVGMSVSDGVFIAAVL